MEQIQAWYAALDEKEQKTTLILGVVVAMM